MATTSFEYAYQDAAGWRKRGVWNVPGTLSDEQVEELRSTFDGEFFVPLAVGMPMLSPAGPDASDDDHCFHTLTEVRTGDVMTDEDRDATQVLESFRRADWSKAVAAHSLGIPMEQA